MQKKKEIEITFEKYFLIAFTIGVTAEKSDVLSVFDLKIESPLELIGPSAELSISQLGAILHDSCQLRSQARAQKQCKQKFMKEKQKVSISKTVACENCAVGRWE